MAQNLDINSTPNSISGLSDDEVDSELRATRAFRRNPSVGSSATQTFARPSAGTPYERMVRNSARHESFAKRQRNIGMKIDPFMPERVLFQKEMEFRNRDPQTGRPRITAITPALDAHYESKAGARPITSAPSADKVQAAISRTAATFKTPPTASAVFARPSAASRVSAIASHLKPGDFIGVKDGNEMAGGEMLSNGQTHVNSITTDPGKVFARRPAQVNSGDGWKPIGEATAALKTENDRALNVFDRGRTLSAAIIQRNQDAAVKANTMPASGSGTLGVDPFYSPLANRRRPI